VLALLGSATARPPRPRYLATRSPSGGPLSDNLTVAVVTSGSSWTLTDNASGLSFSMQVDPAGTFVSFNGFSPYSTTDYSAYQTSLDDGVFPSGLQQALNLSGENSHYTVTQLPPQSMGVTAGLPQWLITYTPTGFVWYVGIGSANSGVTDIMVVHDYQDFFTANLQSFVASLEPVINAGIPILLSLGGDGDGTTWQIMGTDTTQSEIVVAELFGMFGNNSGVDYDWEAGDPTTNVPAMVQFTQDLQAALPNVICTICPYEATQSTLLDVWAGVGLSGISWANFQNYEGPDNFGASALNQFLSAMVTGGLGLTTNSEAAPYVVPGFNAAGCGAGGGQTCTLSQFTGNITALVNDQPNIAGAYTWNLQNMGLSSTVTLSAWASAVAAALAGNPR